MQHSNCAERTKQSIGKIVQGHEGTSEGIRIFNQFPGVILARAIMIYHLPMTVLLNCTMTEGGTSTNNASDRISDEVDRFSLKIKGRLELMSERALTLQIK